MRDASMPDESTLRTLEGVLATEPDVRFAYLFGSAAEGGMGPMSDIDVAVMFDGDPPRSRSLPLLDRIVRRGIVIRDRDPEGRFDFELSTHHRYLDYRSMKDYCRDY